MPIYSKALEALDRKLGRTVTVDDWKALAAKADADLTDDDLTIIESFEGATKAAAVRARANDATTAHDATPATAPREPPLTADVVATCIVTTLKRLDTDHKATFADRVTCDAMRADLDALRLKIASLEFDREQQRQIIERQTRQIADLETAATFLVS